MGCRKRLSCWLACGFAFVSTLYGLIAFSWVYFSIFEPVEFNVHQYHPPSDNFEVTVHISPSRPLNLCFVFVQCCAGAIFCATTLLSILLDTLATICLSRSIFAVCAMLPLMLKFWQHRGSAESGRITCHT